jgi:tRNA U38,U39,U40 pseudouridine synthase TruA
MDGNTNLMQPLVQEVLNNGLSVILNSEISIMGAGRTDTGVHASQMYALTLTLA